MPTAPEIVVNRMIDPATKKIRSYHHMIHPKSGLREPVPSSPEEQGRLRVRGYQLSEVLINTATGTPCEISCESVVQGPQAVLRALAEVREDPRDPEHRGQPAFLRTIDYLKISEAERIKMLWAPSSASSEPDDRAATALELARATAREVDLRARLAEAEKPRASARG